MNVKKSTDYQEFKFLMDNRETSRSHINRLKKAIEANPTILEVQPILVNEKKEIIDGQHRFVAASELGLPIHYTESKGLNIGTARDMNTLQRRWTLADYAMSYAKEGRADYRWFNQMRNKYSGLTASAIMIVMSGASDGDGIGRSFKTGNFKAEREAGELEEILGDMADIRNTTDIPLSKSFVSAWIQATEADEFDKDEFFKNLKKKPELFHRVGTMREGLRLIEDVFNYGKHVNTIRLY